MKRQNHSKEDARRTHHFRRVRASKTATARAARDAELVLEYLVEQENRALSAEQILQGFERGRFSQHRLRVLLRYLVARRDVVAVRGAVLGARTILFLSRGPL